MNEEDLTRAMDKLEARMEKFEESIEKKIDRLDGRLWRVTFWIGIAAAGAGAGVGQVFRLIGS